MGDQIGKWQESKASSHELRRSLLQTRLRHTVHLATGPQAVRYALLAGYRGEWCEKNSNAGGKWGSLALLRLGHAAL